jgi:hypothetical protein
MTLSGSDNSTTFSNLESGTYTVTESGPDPPWSFTSLVCDSTPISGQTATITLAAGEVVKCTFTNEKSAGQPPGTIVVEKQTIPTGDAQEFTFTGDASGPIKDGEQVVVSDLLPGTYHSTEEIPAGWQLVDITCNDTDSANPSSGDVGTGKATFNLDAGEVVKCTFTDKDPSKLGTIVVEKKAIGGDDTFSFTTTGGDGLDGSFQIKTSGGYSSKTFTDIDTGLTYSVTESTPPGDWVFVGTNCTGSFTVPYGGTVTCTFTNELPTGPPPPPAVGGELYSVDKSALMRPYVVGLLGLLGAVSTAVAITRRRRP